MSQWKSFLIFDLYSGNQALTSIQQKMLERIELLVHDKRFNELEHFMRDTPDIEQLLIDYVLLDPTDSYRWDLLIGYERMDRIEDYDRVNAFCRTAFSYHPDKPFYFALALYDIGWNDFEMDEKVIEVANRCIEEASAEVSALICLSMSKALRHMEREYLLRAIERCPWAVQPFFSLGEYFRQYNWKLAKSYIENGVAQLALIFDDSGETSKSVMGFNPHTWQRDVCNELLGMDMSSAAYKKYKRMTK
ncbi:MULTISPECIES: hypothetical protein [unclassified Exiguobacterium]|uniref:hypothetical protein n=1 Tax=unclassified Exiguobacterium TaxID=2644629 RepID=UPI001BE76887|nr:MULTISPECIES: hypothetical protein [unclassified Exiguobacterium]